MSILKHKLPVKSGFVLAVCALVVAALVPFASAQTTKRPISIDDLFKIKSIGDPQRSPDGAWVAYTVGTTDVEKDKRDTDIWMVAFGGGEDEDR